MEPAFSTIAPSPPAAKSFRELPLSPVMQKALQMADYTTATDIQAGLIPLALQGKDVVGQARTGTGKTASFVIPILERLKARKDVQAPQALVMVPTRELAVQVRGEAVKLAEGRKVNIVAVYDGMPLKGQIDKLKKGAGIVVGTPGRVLDLMARGTLDLSRLSVVVLDEADRMLDIGFRPDIEKILRRCPQDRQTLLLSATVPPPIMKLTERYMVDPLTLNFSPKDLSVDTIEQHYFTVDANRKFELLLRLLVREKPRQCIVFCRTKRGTDKVHQRLAKRVPAVASIHGDLSQSQRDRVMSAFREGKIRFLVATDVIGRGIDVSTVSHIVNYDIPMFSDDYVHRVGRTGRMGREGVAFTFVTPEEGHELTRIEERINRLLIRDEMKNFKAVADEGAAPPIGLPAGQPGEGEGADSVLKSPPPPAPPGKHPKKKYRRAL
jgi:ATP-dependent RNA helicase DeaD